MLSAATDAIDSIVCQANDHDFGGIRVPKQKRNTEKRDEAFSNKVNALDDDGGVGGLTAMDVVVACLF
ncbi:hypothetical protein Tco_0592942 [Tanacetum coccineum]